MSLYLGAGLGLYLGMRGGGGNVADFSPLDLGGALVGWFDFEDLSTLSLSDDRITSITDKVSGLVLSQNIGSVKPRYQTQSRINGRPAGLFDGQGTNLRSGSGIVVPYPYGATPCEIWTLAADDSAYPDDTNERFSFAYGGTHGFAPMSVLTQRRAGTVNVSPESVRGQLAVIGDGATSLNAYSASPRGSVAPPTAARHVFGSTEAACSINDGALGSPAVLTPATGNSFACIGSGNGSTNFFRGLINTIIIINPTHPRWTPANIAKLNAWFAERRGIPRQLHSAINGAPLISAINGAPLLSAL